MTLSNLRTTIDDIDDAILDLLAKRASVIDEVARAKQAADVAMYDPERERAVLARLETKGAGLFPRESIRAVFREVMSGCLALQEPARVAFLGPAGTFTHAAARELFGLAARYSESPNIEGVFDAVRRSDAMYGVVPIENSTEGVVTNAVDALIDGEGVVIRRELLLEVSQCLMSRAAGLTHVTRVYSHPQALAQCRVWLATNLPNARLVQTTSTAAAVREAAVDSAGAAIGNRLAADIYDLPVLRDSVQDVAENATRFVLLATEDAPPTGDDKTTVAFAVHDNRGALRRVLDVFDDHGINLSRIESRPSRQKAWDYVFLTDLEGHRENENVRAALAILDERCPMIRTLGSYPRHRA